jgi:hypothetical protein
MNSRWLLAAILLAVPGPAVADRALPAGRPVPGQGRVPPPGGFGSGAPAPRPEFGPVAPPHPSGAAVIELLEDDAGRLSRSLNPGQDLINLGRAGAWGEDCFSGVTALKVAGYQRFREQLPGWNYPVVGTPKAGEYRYLRFAWKRPQGQGIMLQLSLSGGTDWGRYFAGTNSVFYPAQQVNPHPPRDWEVITRDLFEDFGRVPFTLTGMAFTSMDGVALFDHVYLGRTLEDLDKVTNAARHWATRADFLRPGQVEQLWKDVASEDAAVRQPAMWALGACGGSSVPFVAKQVPAPDHKAVEKRIARAIGDLDHARYVVRERASRDLEHLGLTAVPQLEAALVKAGISAEWRTRLEKLVAKGRTGDALLTDQQRTTLRAIRVLEQAETADARALLAELARGGLEAGLSQEAKAALDRLEKRRK